MTSVLVCPDGKTVEAEAAHGNYFNYSFFYTHYKKVTSESESKEIIMIKWSILGIFCLIQIILREIYLAITEKYLQGLWLATIANIRKGKKLQLIQLV